MDFGYYLSRTKLSIMNDDEGLLKPINFKSGVIYECTFYEFGTEEFDNLMISESKNEKNEGTLLGIISKLEVNNKK